MSTIVSYPEAAPASTGALCSHWTAEPGAAESRARESILLVFSDREDRRALGNLLDGHSCERRWAGSLREARELLDCRPASLILCESKLPDGTWRDLWDAVSMPPVPPLLIVAEPGAGHSLWAEVLNLGGYDVLLKPFQPQEVLYSLGSACRKLANHV